MNPSSASSAADFPFNSSAGGFVSSHEGIEIVGNGCGDVGGTMRSSGESAVEREAFDRLLLDHLPVAQRFAVRLCGNAIEAEDLLHDALVRVAAKWATFRGESSFRTWLFQVVVNVFRDRLRVRERQGDQAVGSQPLSEILEDRHAPDPSRDAEHRETGEIVAQAVSTLPPRQREVIVLSAYEQLSSGEIARVLDMTEQNVRTTLHLARERLRTKLAKHLGVAHEH